MNTSPSASARIPAFVAYFLPILGWVYVGVFQRQNRLAVFHLKQSICLILFLIAAFVCWAIIGFLIALIPFGALLSTILFAFVIMALFASALFWVIGMVNALRGRMDSLPLIGGWARRFSF